MSDAWGGASGPRRGGGNLDRLKGLLAEASRHDRPVVDVPSMINHQEQRLLYLLAATYVEGRGSVIDAGIFLGASTLCLAAGLRDNSSAGGAGQITALDLCACDDYMAGLINQVYGTDLAPGDSFEPVLRTNVAGLGDAVDLRVGDIRDVSPDRPIELLFLDVCKDPTINRHIVGAFFPKLIPGVSVVVHQDFVHESLPWIHVSMGLLADYFDFVGVVGAFGPSAVYFCKAQIPTSVCDIYGVASLPVLEAAFRTGVAGLDPVQSYFVDLAYTRLLAGRGLSHLALAELDRLDGLHAVLRQRCSYLPDTSRHRSRLDTDWARVR